MSGTYSENSQPLFRVKGNVGVGHVLAACVGAWTGKVTEQWWTRRRAWARVQLDWKRTGHFRFPSGHEQHLWKHHRFVLATRALLLTLLKVMYSSFWT